MKWDYFISHASEDKQLVVAPFAHYLKAASFAVWYDEFTLKVGDSLLQSISLGLRDSQFGIVFLSPAFFSKRWPQQELAGLFALETPGKKRILPVWHQLSSTDLAEYSPILADRKAADTQRGLQYVAEQIVMASFPERTDQLPLSSAVKTNELEAKEARKIFQGLLAGNPTINDIYLYLSGYPILLQSLVGYAPELIPGFKLPTPIRCDFAQLIPHGTTGPVEVLFVVLGPVNYDHEIVKTLLRDISRDLGNTRVLNDHPGNDYLGSPYFGEYPSMRKLGSAIKQLVRSNNIHWNRPDTWSFKLMIITGRRGQSIANERDALAKKGGMRVDIASYDRLLDDKESIYR